MKKIKKSKSVVAISLGIFLGTLALGGVGFGMYCLIQTFINLTNNKDITILSNEKVLSNFSNGEWKDKKYLTQDDLSKYKKIESTAFDSLNNVLDYIELSGSQRIEFTTNTNFIRWDQVNEIRVVSAKENNIFEYGNLIYTKSNLNISQYIPSTISKRNVAIDISIPSINSNQYSFVIIDNFFELMNFKKNIQNINFAPDVNITNIGNNAFRNCSILSPSISIINSNSQTIYIGKKAFENTNITSFSIESNQPIIPVYIDENAFLNSKKLNNIYIHTTSWIAYDYAFSGLSENLRFTTICNSFSLVDTNVFANDYQSLLLGFGCEWEPNDTLFIATDAFSGINVPISEFTFITNWPKSNFENTGLTPEQLAKIIVEV